MICEKTEINDYLARIGIRKITELDTAYLRRQEELVNYLNQSLQMSLLAASFYDRVFFRRTMEYLLGYDSFWQGDIFDIGCGNGILTCFLALGHPNSFVTGLDLSQNATSVAEEFASKLQIDNVRFVCPPGLPQGQYGTLFSCRTAHENVAWRSLMDEHKTATPTVEEHEKQHMMYARKLSALVKPGGYLVSVEHNDDNAAYAGLVCAFERLDFSQMKETHMQFSCKNGDETATFQAIIFQK